MKTVCRIALVLAALVCCPAAAKTAPKTPDALVRGLYEQVVARHPLGIPHGEDLKVFTPYLSKTLLHRFDVANACAADYFRQYPDPDLKPDVALFEDGIFSGSSEQAEPQAFEIGRTERRKGGTAHVHVKLTWQDSATPPLIWYVAAVVVRKNGRPVVDDILFLKDDDRTIDWRMSKGLATGCDGTRWVGSERE